MLAGSDRATGLHWGGVITMPRGRRGPHRFYSQAQWRWAFARHKPWARRHAHKTPGPRKIRYRRLPYYSTHARSASRSIRRRLGRRYG